MMLRPHEEFIAQATADAIERMSDSQFCGFLAALIQPSEQDRNVFSDAVTRRMDIIGMKLEAIEAIENDERA